MTRLQLPKLVGKQAPRARLIKKLYGNVKLYILGDAYYHNTSTGFAITRPPRGIARGGTFAAFSSFVVMEINESC